MSVQGFARRWSRRKRAATQAVQSPESAPVEEPPPVETVELKDIAGWLKRNVPEAWKLAALRRLWVADPTIRDFIGPADYAWDWNTPGSVPGVGPLRDIDDAARLLARAVGQGPKPPTPRPQRAAPKRVAPNAPPPAVAQPAASPDPPQPVRRRGGRATPV
jgi:hypothetical protein